MAKAPMLKMHLLAPRERREELMEWLYGLRAVHVLDLASRLATEEETAVLLSAFQPNVRGWHLELSRADFLLDFMERYGDAKKGSFGGLIPDRVHVSEQEWETLLEDVDMAGLYREAEALDVRFKQLVAESAELEREVQRLAPWNSLDMPLAELAGSETTCVVPGSLLEKDWAEFSQRLEETCPHSAVAAVHRHLRSVYLIIMVSRDEEAGFAGLAQLYGFEQFALRGMLGTAAEEIAGLREKLETVTAEKDAISKRARALANSYSRVVACRDYIANALNKEDTKGALAHTERVIALEGWVEKRRQGDLADAVAELGEDVYLSFSAPAEDDEPPTLLTNRRPARPVEALVSLFGFPHSRETDPTPVMAPFFIFFFGLCVGDVGYGIILALLCWLMMKKLDVSDNAKRFFRLFMYCGFATILAGVLTRGYFGINPEHLPAWMKFTGSFDTLNAPISIMAFCAALGITHIWIGLFIEMWDNARNNSWWDGLCEQGTTLLFWAALPVLVVGYAAKAGPVKSIGWYMLLAGAAGIIFLSNKSAKSWAGKFFGGLFNLYGSIGGTIGDVASYMRLYALGLATVLIAEVVNRMGVMMFQGIPVAGIVIMLLIFAVGHTFNFAINLIGAFVHPLRLQYVEFFGKFYEDGAKPFHPLGIECKKTVIENGSLPVEGKKTAVKQVRR